MFRGLGFQAITAGVLYCCQIGYSRPNRLRCSLLVCGDPAGTNPVQVGKRIETHRVRVMSVLQPEHVLALPALRLYRATSTQTSPKTNDINPHLGLGCPLEKRIA